MAFVFPSSRMDLGCPVQPETKSVKLPLSSTVNEDGLGIDSKIVRLVGSSTGETRVTGWVRELVEAGRVNYIADYSTCTVPNYPGTCLRVVFPLPNGNATVVLSPEVSGQRFTREVLEFRTAL